MISIQNLTYLSISKWINDYADTLKTFFVDERISDGIRQLLKTYFEKTSATSEVIIDGIIDFNRKNPPSKDDQNQLYSSTPYDLFKIINEIFDLSYKFCPLRETALKMSSFAKKILTSFHSKLQELLVIDFIDKSKGLAYRTRRPLPWTSISSSACATTP